MVGVAAGAMAELAQQLVPAEDPNALTAGPAPPPMGPQPLTGGIPPPPIGQGYAFQQLAQQMPPDPWHGYYHPDHLLTQGHMAPQALPPPAAPIMPPIQWQPEPFEQMAFQGAQQHQMGVLPLQDRPTPRRSYGQPPPRSLEEELGDVMDPAGPPRVDHFYAPGLTMSPDSRIRNEINRTIPRLIENDDDTWDNALANIRQWSTRHGQRVRKWLRDMQRLIENPRTVFFR